MELILLPRPCSSGFFSLPDPLRLLPSPTHSVADCSFTSFHLLQVPRSSPTTGRGAASHFAFAYRVTSSGAAGDFCQSSRGHARFFRTVPPAITMFLLGE